MKKFAFLIHPRASAKEDMGKVFWPFRLVPESLLQWGIKYLPPIPRGQVSCPINGDEVAGWMVVVPLTGHQFFSLPRKFVLEKIIQAIQKAEKLGAEVVGLGELTSSITHGGKNLIGKVEIAVTNGNSLTAGITVQAVKKACQELKGVTLSEQKVAVVGATGSVGNAVSLLLAEEDSSLILLARGKARLEKLREKIASQFPACQVTISQNLNDIREAGAVIVVTSGVGQVIQAEHLKEDALVYDITQPRNTSPFIMEERPDVVILDGGVIATPFNYGMDIGLNKGEAYACLVETMLLALEGNGSCVGDATPEQAKKMLGLMEKHPHLFQLAPFQSFGAPLKRESIPVAVGRFSVQRASPS